MTGDAEWVNPHLTYVDRALGGEYGLEPFGGGRQVRLPDGTMGRIYNTNEGGNFRTVELYGGPNNGRLAALPYSLGDGGATGQIGHMIVDPSMRSQVVDGVRQPGLGSLLADEFVASNPDMTRVRAVLAEDNAQAFGRAAQAAGGDYNAGIEGTPLYRALERRGFGDIQAPPPDWRESPFPPFEVGRSDPSDPARPRDGRPRTTADGVEGARPDAGPDGRPAAGEGGTARTTAGDAGGGTGTGDCPNCIPGGGNRAGQAGTAGEAGVQAAPADPPPPPPGARSAPGAPPPPADGAEAFARAQRTGGSEQGGVVYAVGGDPDNHQIYRYTPDGQYLGPADPLGRGLNGATSQGVASQVIDLQNPGVPRQRFFSGDNGERYAIGPEGMAEVRPDGTMRTLSAAERSSLPHHVQSQAMQRIAGPTLAMPDGVNGGMYRRLGQEVLGNGVDGLEMQRDIAQAGRLAEAGAPLAPLPAGLERQAARARARAAPR